MVSGKPPRVRTGNTKGTAEAPVWSGWVPASVATYWADNLVTVFCGGGDGLRHGRKDLQRRDRGSIIQGQPLCFSSTFASAAGKGDLDRHLRPFYWGDAGGLCRQQRASEQTWWTHTHVDDGELDVILGGGRRSFLADPDGRRCEHAAGGGGGGARTRWRHPRSGGVGQRADPRLFATAELGLPGSGAAPTLAGMTEAALARLSQDQDGFFLVVEEERADLRAHVNDGRR